MDNRKRKFSLEIQRWMAHKRRVSSNTPPNQWTKRHHHPEKLSPRSLPGGPERDQIHRGSLSETAPDESCEL